MEPDAFQNIDFTVAGVKVIGFLCCFIDREEDEDVWYLSISDIMVERNWRKRGVGHDLVRRAEEYARKMHISYIRLASLAANKNVVGMYRHFGFRDYLIYTQKKIAIPGKKHSV